MDRYTYQFSRSGADERLRRGKILVDRCDMKDTKETDMYCKWQVGKTYKTTLPGVTATITDIEGDDVIGDVSNRTCRAWRWCKVDGKFRMFENSQEHPHLTTELADEPQVEPVKPQPVDLTTELADEPHVEPSPRFTVVRRGEKWGVSDLQRPGMHAPFGTHTRACWACDEMTDVGGDNGYGFVYDEPSESDIEAVLSDPVVSDDGRDEPTVDVINNPPHYTQGGIECIDAIQSALSPEEFRGFLRANVIKYVWRCEHKGGCEDLRKAEWYLKRLIAAEGGE